MKEEIRSSIKSALIDIGVEQANIPDFVVELPKDPSHGDLATNVALMLKKAFGEQPRVIAEKIAEKLRERTNQIEQVDVAGPGFLNIRIRPSYLAETFRGHYAKGSTIGLGEQMKGTKVLVEFVSANPTGPLTVGHGRNAVLGDTISRLYEWCGASVQREYYFNNAGRQMRMLGQSVQTRYQQLCGEDIPFLEGGYEGEYIREIAQDLRLEFGDSLLNEPDEKRFKERAEKEIFAMIEATLDRMNIHMDSYFNENSLYEDGSIDRVIADLREKDLVYDAEGAVWFRTTRFGKEKDTVLIKSTGEPTYRLPDIAYHVKKLQRGYDLCIDIFGADHIDTYPDVVEAVRQLGLPAEKIDVLVYQFVTLVKDGKPLKMSTRKANYVTLDELMDEVGSDVTRFFFLMRTPSTHLEFDIDQAKEASDKNPVFYLQYAHARIQSILRKVKEEGSLGSTGLLAPQSSQGSPGNPESSGQQAATEWVSDSEIDWNQLDHPAEIRLMKTALQFSDAIHLAATSKEPQKLINYLNKVASDFTAFYHDCRILGEPQEKLVARGALAATIARVLSNGLQILGITAPDRM